MKELNLKLIPKLLTAGRAKITVQWIKPELHKVFLIKYDPESEDHHFTIVHFTTVKIVGHIRNLTLFPEDRSALSTSDIDAQKLFMFLWKNIIHPEYLKQYLKVYHMGTCLKCGRELSDPESIEIGLGPICKELLT